MCKKYRTAIQATDDHAAHAHFILDTSGYKHHRICNTAFPLQKCLMNPPQYYLTRTASVLLYFELIRLIVFFPMFSITLRSPKYLVQGAPYSLVN
jgi:hypothetical protein